MANKVFFVQGFCPACGNPTLAIDEFEARLGCTEVDCPRPTAAHDVLSDDQTLHLVTLRRDDFTVRHPLIERLDNRLEECRIHAALADCDDMPMGQGVYTVDVDDMNELEFVWVSYLPEEGE